VGVHDEPEYAPILFLMKLSMKILPKFQSPTSIIYVAQRVIKNSEEPLKKQSPGLLA